MQTHNIVSRPDLLAGEKAWTREGDRLARMRPALPWVRVNKDYVFEIVPKERNEMRQGNLMDWIKRQDQYEPAGEAAPCCTHS